MKSESCELLIIGGGPGGYSCGVRAAQLGLDTIVVEADKPGGTCLNVGCIPSKALIHAADEFAKARSFAAKNELGISAAAPRIDLSATVDWKDAIVKRLNNGVSGLLRSAKARLVKGNAQLVDGKTVDVDTDDGPVRIRTQNLVIATGSQPQPLSALPFGDNIISSTELLEMRHVPERLAIIGGGYIGLEIGTAMAKLGSAVTIVEAAGRILPQYDAQLSGPVAARLAKLGVKVLTSTIARGLEDDGRTLLVEGQEGVATIDANHILVTVGRRPSTEGFGLEALGLERNGSFIAVDAHCATSMRGVYAIGDVTGDPMLAHRAMAQGVMVAEIIAGRPRSWDKRVIPAVCFTDPEIVVAGALPGEIDGAKIAVFPFTANGRAMTMERTDGFVRVVFDPSTELVLGLQAVGAGVSELAGQFATAIEMASTLTDIADTIHAHPTLGETVQEVAAQALHDTISGRRT